MKRSLHSLADEIRACRHCVETPAGAPLPHEPRPVLRVSTTARICVCGQAPGTRVHGSGVPFADPSGDRLRLWMGVSDAEFYDVARIAIVPMGFCFPGLDAKGGDLPPRRECAPLWRAPIFTLMPAIDLMLLVGRYSQLWHLGSGAGPSLTATVSAWRDLSTSTAVPQVFALPHPSWRNNAWLKRNSWFERDLLPELQAAVRARL